ncbi:MAG: c-type cytochrome [Bacteroidota bacterium]|nr:c-type cytochrome [Bacteroidota bacterium]
MNLYRSINFSILFSLLLFSTSNSLADDVQSGEKLFKQNCTACHSMTTARLVGPGLEGVTDKYEKEWLIKWIRNSQEMIASGDERAIAIYEEYNKVAMTAFDFSDQEFSDLLAYLANPPIQEEKDIASSTDLVDQGMSNSTQLMIIALVLVTLVFMLVSLKNNLKSALGQETETIPETLIGQYSLFISKNINVVFLCAVVAIVMLKFTYDGLMGVGVTTSYQPAQPIEFSHKVHAGQNGIDCNYCHSSARKSKHSGIPSANVCMNCHTYINEGAITGTDEIQKIYDAVGFDPQTRTYIEGYEQQPIEWVRIHNLPDHAYFNHSQHVVAGGIECQECHGPVEEMDVLYQYAPLTMDWCIECHRETEVQMEGNNYYTHLHEQLKEKYKGQKITVDKMGGLECAKCHY